MTADGGLRALYRKYLLGWQLTAIESGITSPGVPDTEFCAPNGVTGWIENKMTSGWGVNLRPLQIGWIDRRARLGGRVFIAVRRIATGRKSLRDEDELYIVKGVDVKALATEGLKTFMPATGEDRFPVFIATQFGPTHWDWDFIAQRLSQE